jgi:hypothetical protein
VGNLAPLIGSAGRVAVVMPTNSPVMGITVGTRETGWGELEDLQVPMLECQECLHDVVVYWTIVEKFKRFWLDLDQDVPFGSGLCQSLRDLSERWSAILGSSVGLRTINERINQIEPLLQQVHQEPITDVPTVVQFDGIWVTIQRQTETIKLDKRQRRHHQRNGKRVVILVALGFWNDGSGRREVLDWQIASSAVFSTNCAM